MPLDLTAQHRRGRLLVGDRGRCLVDRRHPPARALGSVSRRSSRGGRSSRCSEYSRTSRSPNGARWSARFAPSGGAASAIAALMAISSSAPFITALNHTSVANVLFMQCDRAGSSRRRSAPHSARPVARRTWIAMVVAVLGVALMVGGPGQPAGVRLRFDGSDVRLVRRPDRDRTPPPRRLDGARNVPLAAHRASCSPAPFSSPGSVSMHDLGLLVALGVGQIGLGLVLLTMGARLIPAAEVALISLLESRCSARCGCGSSCPSSLARPRSPAARSCSERWSSRPAALPPARRMPRPQP